MATRIQPLRAMHRARRGHGWFVGSNCRELLSTTTCEALIAIVGISHKVSFMRLLFLSYSHLGVLVIWLGRVGRKGDRIHSCSGFPAGFPKGCPDEFATHSTARQEDSTYLHSKMVALIKQLRVIVSCKQ